MIKELCEIATTGMYMEILLREIKSNDAQQIMFLSKQLGYEISLQDTKNNIETLIKQPHTMAYVAEVENKVAGWITVAYILSISSVPFCEIHGLVVDEQFRKNNIGKMLIEKVKQWCTEKNCDTLRLRCNVKRKETHAFYLHLGFAEKKEQKVFEIDV